MARTGPSRWAATGEGLQGEQRARAAIATGRAHAGVIDRRQTERTAEAQNAVAGHLHIITLSPSAAHASVSTW